MIPDHPTVARISSGFLVSHRGLRKPRHFYGVSPLGTMSDHNWQVFHPRGDLSLLADNRHIFSLPFYSTLRLCWTLSHLPTMHSHPFNAMSPCICNARCHCMLYHVTYMMNATWTTQSTPLTGVMDNHITCI